MTYTPLRRESRTSLLISKAAAQIQKSLALSVQPSHRATALLVGTTHLSRLCCVRTLDVHPRPRLFRVYLSKARPAAHRSPQLLAACACPQESACHLQSELVLPGLALPLRSADHRRHLHS